MSTALHAAADKGHTECVRVLLDRGADINCKDANNFTPLHLSARSGHIESFKLLVERGGDIDKNQLAGYPIEYKKIIEQDLMNRKQRRIDFDMFVTKYIEYKPWRDNIYSACFPGGSNQILPPIGWQRAEELRDKYYYDEILFLVQLHIAKLYSSSLPNLSELSTTPIKNSSDSYKLLYLAKKSNKIYLSPAMTIISPMVKEFLKPESFQEKR